MLDFLNTLFRSLSPLWEMSLTGAYAAAILIVLRLVLKKRAPRQVLCLLWLVVFARLLIPVSLESPLSIVPEARPVQAQVHPGGETVGQFPENPATPTAPVQNPAQGQNPGIAANPAISNPNPGEPTLTPPEGVHPDVPRPETPAPFPWQAVLAGVWLAGAITMAGCGLISYLRLRRRLFDAIRAPDGAWEHPAVDSPFILGMIRPRIYLPAGLVGQPRQFILCHERAHLRRLDHIVKPVCWAALALHWFNPLVWAAYLLMSRDIEAACDEAVIRRLGSQVKADYSTTLLALATGRRLPAPSPLAFDEGDAKGRIKNVLGYRRPALWVIVVSAVMAVMAAVCLLTDPVAARNPEVDPDADPGPTASQPPEANLADALLDPWMKEVLDGERQFISAYFQHSEGDGRPYGIHDLRTFYYGDDQYPDAVVEAGRLAVIDLDRDGINEMVIWPEGEDEYLYSVVGYVILRRQGDEIYGYNPGYRTFGSVKSDGTFSWSNGASWNGCATLTFGPDQIILHETTYHRPGESETDQLYFVDGRRATKEEHSAAQGWQNLKPSLAWYTYDSGQLRPYLPAGAELLAGTGPDSAGTAKLWTGEYDHPWLEWNGTVCQLMPTITAEMLPYLFVQDFDGDGQNELVIRSHLNYFGTYDVYEWNNGQVTYADSFDTQDDLLLRFNQNNVASYNKDTREFSVTYAHTEGDPDSADYYRHYVTGSTTLPINFFDGYEHIRDGYTYAYANDFRQISLNPEDNSFLFELLFCPADETMKDLIRVVEPDTAVPDEHYMKGRTVGTAAFTLRYNGAKWVLEEPDRLDMGIEDEPTPMDITTAAPLSAPVVGISNDLPDDPEKWYKVAELPDDLIWMYARNYGQETLIRWDGNFYKVFHHVAHTPHCTMPQLKKLGGADTYGPLAVISHVDSGTGVFAQELVVYDLDAADAVDYAHDWSPLAEDFNNSFSYQYDRDTRVLTCTYAGQTVVRTLTLELGDDDITRLSITGEQVYYSFDETNDGRFQLRLGVQAFADGNMTSLFPVSVSWTLQFNGKGFDVVPGSCVLS